MYIDLTLELSERIPTFPGGPKPEITQLATIEQDGTNERRLSFNSHFSTHMDAPFHMLESGKKLDEYPIDSFIGRAKVIDVRGMAVIQAEHIGDLEGCPIALLWTEHNAKIFEPGYFENNPVFSIGAAEELIRQRVTIVGLDSFTPDNAPYTVHKLLFQHDIRILENLTNLKNVFPACQLFIAPLNLKDADGAPCRVFAEV